ncbi:hypothetical protein [Flavobacterium sp. HSC-61S13]|uniref:hypothetical protein n=1 Tax=Flavobacterium sp. HSC-61S13 TaxID=2910963 RepID=UPI00209F3C28|nr:hypothetical protein [Flavobacterium sp. HSC-61S13]MCP1996188.1 hypothetical protein [Flavobacterium sp. HSC-61S13]
MRLLSLFLCLFSLVNLSYGQEVVYELQHKTEKARINQSAFKKLKSGLLQTQYDVIDTFTKPTKGKSDVYCFIATYEGNSFDGTTKTFHDYLVLEVDPKTQLIKDGYQYTLEWADSPYVDLYRINNKSTVLQDGLNINTLDFRCFSIEPTDSRYLLKENGRLKSQ